MRINEFIAECRAQWSEFDDSRRLAVHEYPRDRYLAALPRKIQGMATENKLMLLNLGARCLATDEVYVEIGCWQGLSLAGAALNNPNARIFACDDFSQFDGKPEPLSESIQNYTMACQVRFFDMDFLSFLDLAPWQPARVGVFFYDGGHTFQQQYHALEHVLPWLAKEAIVIIDDTNAGEVRSANKQFVSQVPNLQLLTDIRTPRNGSPTWWNGVQVYLYRSSGSRSVRAAGLDYHVRRVFWDTLIPPARGIMRTIRKTASAIPGLRSLYRYLRHRWTVVANPNS